MFQLVNISIAEKLYMLTFGASLILFAYVFHSWELTELIIFTLHNFQDVTGVCVKLEEQVEDFHWVKAFEKIL